MAYMMEKSVVKSDLNQLISVDHQAMCI